MHMTVGRGVAEPQNRAQERLNKNPRKIANGPEAFGDIRRRTVLPSPQDLGQHVASEDEESEDPPQSKTVATNTRRPSGLQRPTSSGQRPGPCSARRE
jgi:hypothetical protein